jgi:hypothetical protein
LGPARTDRDAAHRAFRGAPCCREATRSGGLVRARRRKGRTTAASGRHFAAPARGVEKTEGVGTGGTGGAGPADGQAGAGGNCRRGVSRQEREADDRRHQSGTRGAPLSEIDRAKEERRVPAAHSGLSRRGAAHDQRSRQSARARARRSSRADAARLRSERQGRRDSPGSDRHDLRGRAGGRHQSEQDREPVGRPGARPVTQGANRRTDPGQEPYRLRAPERRATARELA